jgi:hypothetical protein
MKVFLGKREQRRLRVLALRSVFAAVSLSVFVGRANIIHFQGGPDGPNPQATGQIDWSDPSNWFEGNEPGLTDTAMFNVLPYGSNPGNNNTWVNLNNNDKNDESESAAGLTVLRGAWRIGGANLYLSGDLVVGDYQNPEQYSAYHQAFLAFDTNGHTFQDPYYPVAGGFIYENGTTYIGKSIGSDGTLSLFNPYQEASMFANNMYVGLDGKGTVDVTNNSFYYNNLYIGMSAGAIGVINGDGAGGGMQSAYYLPGSITTIGGAGTGTINLTNGAFANFKFATLGALAGSLGTINASTNSTITATNFHVGLGGEGVINLNSGATLTMQTDNNHFGYFDPNNGTIFVQGNANAVGSINLNGGSTVSAIDRVTVGDYGAINVSGHSTFKFHYGSLFTDMVITASQGTTSNVTVDNSIMSTAGTFVDSNLYVGLDAEHGTGIATGAAKLTIKNGGAYSGSFDWVSGGEIDVEGSGSNITAAMGQIGYEYNPNTASLNLIAGGNATYYEQLKTGDHGVVSVVGGGNIGVGYTVGPVAAGHIQVGDGGVLGGTGTFLGDVDVTGGTLDPGYSPGIMTVDGNVTMTSGLIDLQIGGPDPGSGYDVLNVTGNLTITGGTIQFDSYNGYTPTVGQVFDFFHSGHLTIGSGVTIVDLTGYGNGSGVDFNPATGSGKIAAVPEPASFGAISIGLLGLLRSRRKKQS